MSNFPNLELRYTKKSFFDSETTQPKLSIGGFPDSKEVFPSGSLSGWINSSQNTIPIDPSYLPESTSGLVSIGPEIMYYGDVDYSNNQLLSVTRNINNLRACPSGKNRYNEFDKVYYLNNDTSTNLNKLFDISVDKDLFQYRCVAIVYDNPDGFDINNVSVNVLQNQNSNTKFYIGVEIPQHDSFSSIHQGSSSTTTIYNSYFQSFPSGYFNNEIIYHISSGKYFLIENFTNGTFTIIQQSGTVTINNNDRFVVLPSASKRSNSLKDYPSSNLFSGFYDINSPVNVYFNNHLNLMKAFDVFYVWIKQVVDKNSHSKDDSGAILVVAYDDSTLSISGTITYEDSTPVPGISLVINGTNGTSSSSSDSGGKYSIEIPSEWNGTVTPTNPIGYIILPSSYSFINVISSKTQEDFLVLTKYTISGNVKDSLNSPQVHAIVNIIGTSNGYTYNTTGTTDSSGNYSVSIPKGWTGKVSLSSLTVISPVSGYYNFSNIVTNHSGTNFITQHSSLPSGGGESTVNESG